MYKKTFFTCVLSILLFTVSACGESAPQDTAPSETATVQEVEEPKVVESAVEATSEPEEEEEQREEFKEEKAYYTDEFTKADKYEKYGDSGDAKTTDLIWIEGYIDEYNADSKTYVLTADEGKWSVSAGGNGTDYYYDLAKEAVGKKVRVFGMFTGYSKDLEMPSIAFQPKDYMNYAFRLESVDNDFRLTQLDYRSEEPDFDGTKQYGKLIFKESSKWQGKYMDDSLLYYFSDVMPALIMSHFEDANNLAGSQFDEVSMEDTLLSLADSYVNSEDEIIRKNSFELQGYPALCFESTWTDDSLPMPMSLYCYMFIVDDQYYYFGCGEPYLVGESSKRLLSAMLKDFKIGDTIVTAQEDSSETSKTDSKEEAKTETKEEAKTEDKAESKEKEASAETPATETQTAEEPKEPETKKSQFPTKDELLGKVFTQTLTATLTGKNNEGSYSGTDTLPDILITADMLANYNEATGVTTFSTTSAEESMSTVMSFFYDASGKIQYTGSVSMDAAQYTGEGTISGVQR